MHKRKNDDPRRLQELADMAAVVSTPEGARLLSRILGHSNVLGTSYAVNDPYATAHNEGLRRLGVWLIQEMEEARPGAVAALFLSQQEDSAHV